MVALLNSINEVAITVNGTNDELIVELINETWIHNVVAGVFPPVDYTLETPNGLNSQIINTGNPISIPVANFISDGVYKCRIVSNYGAIVEFEVKVQDGLFTEWTTSIIQTINYDLDCTNYPDYPLQVQHEIYTTDTSINGYELNFNLTSIASDSVAPANSMTTDDSSSIILPDTNIFHVTETANGNALTHKSIFNTQCIVD